MVDLWLDSPGHRDILLSPRARRAGVSVEQDAQGRVIGSFTTIFNNVGLAMQALRNVGVSLASIFLDIAMVGSGFLPGLATGFANAAASAQRVPPAK